MVSISQIYNHYHTTTKKTFKHNLRQKASQNHGAQTAHIGSISCPSIYPDLGLGHNIVEHKQPTLSPSSLNLSPAVVHPPPFSHPLSISHWKWHLSPSLPPPS